MPPEDRRAFRYSPIGEGILILEPHAIAVFALTIGALVLFSSDRMPLETTSVLVLAALVLGFQLFPFERNGVRLVPADFFLGFGHEALVTICSLMVLGKALEVTGALEPVARLLAPALAKRPQLALLPVLVFCAAASGVLNDTPIVVLMMPILVSAALRSGTPPGRTLLPMNYAVLIGGMGTTIGTSTNLLVVTIAADLGVRRFQIFDFLHVTALAAIGGLLYLWLVLPRLLPERGAPIGDAAPQHFAAVLHVAAESFADGKPLSEVLGKLGKASLQRIVRGSGLELARLPTLTLQAGDRLYVSAPAENLREGASATGATLHNVDEAEHPVDDEHPLEAGEQHLAEVVVTEGSPLLGWSLRNARFAALTHVIVVGLQRARGVRLAAGDDVADVALRAGDVLLVQGTESDMDRLARQAGLLVLDRSHHIPRTEKAPLALTIMAAVVAAAALKVVPISAAAVSGVAAMVLTRCISWERAAGALSAKVILLVAASLALGAALTRTGGTDFLAAQLVAHARDLSPAWLLTLLMVLMAVVTNFVSNSAAAAIGTPIAVSIAAQLGVSAEPLVLAIMFGANFCYVTPMAYQTNLLVMGAAGYRFSDYVRGGTPLLVIMLCGYAVLLPRFFPF